MKIAEYKEFKAPKVIFSEGAAMNVNPWFTLLKSALTPIKGETLSFECRAEGAVLYFTIKANGC